MHGWTHHAGPEGLLPRRFWGQVVARGAAEFVALDETPAADRLTSGREVLRELGLTTHGFTPPGRLASAATNRAPARLGFRYTTSHLGVHDLRTGHTRHGFALSHRPGGAGERPGNGQRERDEYQRRHDHEPHVRRVPGGRPCPVVPGHQHDQPRADGRGSPPVAVGGRTSRPAAARTATG